MAIANVVAFYTFLFAVFFILSEFLLLFWQCRKPLGKLFRPVLAHVPAFILMSFWVLTLLDRYQVVQSYVYSKMLIRDPSDQLIYFGTGIIFKQKYIISILVNLPFIVGFYLSFKHWKKGSPQFFIGMLFTISVGIIIFLSIVKQSIFFNRYLIFLLPLYLGLSFFGWLQIEKKKWQRLGVSLMMIVLLLSYAYYDKYFMEVNDEYRYHGLYHTAKDDDGRSISKTAAFLQNRIAKDEVIIHFSRIVIRTLSYFPSLYYHTRSLPEYIYSAEELPIHCGQQYLHPGDRIAKLEDINPRPLGIWLVTWEPPEKVIFDSPWFLVQRKQGKLWYKQENLPEQIYKAGYRSQEVVRFGGISAIHFLKIVNAPELTGEKSDQ